MEAMGVGAIVVNTALIGVSGQVQRLLPHFSNWDCLLLMGVCEVRGRPEMQIHCESQCDHHKEAILVHRLSPLVQAGDFGQTNGKPI